MRVAIVFKHSLYLWEPSALSPNNSSKALSWSVIKPYICRSNVGGINELKERKRKFQLQHKFLRMDLKELIVFENRKLVERMRTIYTYVHIYTWLSIAKYSKFICKCKTIRRKTPRIRKISPRQTKLQQNIYSYLGPTVLSK